MFTLAARREGFTLVELSIVLVIIGLLIGGILVAQSMIAAANVTAAIKQIVQFDAGVENFKTKYNYLPGDAPGFGGNGDGLIDATIVHYTPATSATTFTCEIANFWNNLFPDQYSSSPCVQIGGPAYTSGPSQNVPLSKIGKPGSFFVAATLTTDSAFGDLNNPSNYYFILDSSHVQAPIGANYDFAATTSSNSAVRPTDLLALDTKIDDGLANSGNIISGSVGNYSGSNAGGIVNTPASGICSSGATYLVNDTGYECTPLIRIGAQAGDPQ